MVAGTPMARAPAGTTMSSRISAAAATTAPASTRARFSTREPEPMRQPSSTTHPSRCARCPTTQPAPITVGHSLVVWMIVPSWIEVRAPTRISPWSPRSTAPGHTEEPAPSSTFPMITASGCTKASGSMTGTWSSSA